MSMNTPHKRATYVRNQTAESREEERQSCILYGGETGMVTVHLKARRKGIDLRDVVEREHCGMGMLKLLRKIDMHAQEGQDGSANYAMDRLARIRDITALAIRKLTKP